jgi:hypothetical protein
VAEAHRELVFYDPQTWAVQDTLQTPDCAGIDPADFTADGRTAVFTCEFAGRVAVVDVVVGAVPGAVFGTRAHQAQKEAQERAEVYAAHMPEGAAAAAEQTLSNRRKE